MILTDDEGKPFVKPVRSDFRTDHEFTQAFHEYKRRIEGAQSSAVYHHEKDRRLQKREPSMKYETRGVSGDAKKTHTVEIDEGGTERVLCKKIDVDSLAAADKNVKPTCPVCAKRDPRFMTIWELNKFELRGTKINPAFREWQRELKKLDKEVERAKKAHDKTIGAWTTPQLAEQERLWTALSAAKAKVAEHNSRKPPARIKK